MRAKGLGINCCMQLNKHEHFRLRARALHPAGVPLLTVDLLKIRCTQVDLLLLYQGNSLIAADKGDQIHDSKTLFKHAIKAANIMDVSRIAKLSDLNVRSGQNLTCIDLKNCIV